MAEESLSRPRRVVIIDEDMPWVEITGEFFSREDHERLVVEARHQGYEQGFQAGVASVPVRPAPYPRQRTRRRLGLRARLFVVVLALAVLLELLSLAVQVAYWL